MFITSDENKSYLSISLQLVLSADKRMSLTGIKATNCGHCTIQIAEEARSIAAMTKPEVPAIHCRIDLP